MSDEPLMRFNVELVISDTHPIATFMFANEENRTSFLQNLLNLGVIANISKIQEH